MTSSGQPLTAQAKRGSVGEVRRFFARWEWMLVLLILVVVVANTALSPFFLRPNNLLRASRDFIELGLMMLPMVFVIITGSIDLSVASMLGMTASFMGWLFNMGVNIWVAAVAALALGALAGLLNGFLIAKVKLPALVVTLGTYAFYRGMAYALLGDEAARGYPAGFTYIGQGRIGATRIPVGLLLLALLALGFGLLLHKSVFGRYTYGIGNNEEACRYAGVPVDRVKMLIFVASGFMAALAGIVLAARFGSTRPDIATGMELDVITATVLGGVSISGGSGTMVGALLSLVLIGVMRFGMGLMNIQGQVQGIIIGFLLILSIMLPNLGRRLGQGRRLRAQPRTLAYAAAAIIIAALFVWFFAWSRMLVLANA